ncbi:MAG TPA: hypothetical protein PLP73_03670, partial [Candidatus Absconditabacterales bacterium]|nr:hypothetical protein [Candidatus Absconditabacterales bacterium]
MKVLKHIKNWWLGGDTNSDLEKKEIEIKDNVQECDGVEIGADSNKKCNVGKSTRFFDKIALLKLADSKKSEIAQQIINDSYSTKLYWIQLFLACIIAALGLFMNSIPVTIGAMLISPLLDPIK